MTLSPLNDFCKIKLDPRGPLSAQPGDVATSGILVELPERLTHFGYYSFVAEASFMNDRELGRLLDHWKQFIGKRVYWLALSEKGAILKDSDGDKFAYVKLTSLMAVGDSEDEAAESIVDKYGGSFSV